MISELAQASLLIIRALELYSRDDAARKKQVVRPLLANELILAEQVTLGLLLSRGIIAAIEFKSPNDQPEPGSGIEYGKFVLPIMGRFHEVSRDTDLDGFPFGGGTTRLEFCNSRY